MYKKKVALHFRELFTKQYSKSDIIGLLIIYLLMQI